MLYKEINQKFTDVVNSYLAEGYHFNTGTMEDGYSYGSNLTESHSDITHVDLTDGSEIVRVKLENFSCREESHYFQGIQLSVGILSIQGSTDVKHDSWVSISAELEIIQQERFYDIGRSSSWYVTKEEVVARLEKSCERYEVARSISQLLEQKIELNLAKAAPIVLPYVRRQPRCKTVKLADIVSVTKQDQNTAFYYIEVKGKGRLYSISK